MNTETKPLIALLTADEAARYLGVRRTFFDANIRPHIPETDMRAPNAQQPMPRFAIEDLDAFRASRRRTKADVKERTA